jgi:hypothetical protein
MAKVKAVFAQRAGLDINDLRLALIILYNISYLFSFIHNNRRVNDSDTPCSLKMGNIEEVYIYVEPW